eukprot:SAG11_NODE_15464_length_577_cov_1.154812_1_plen_69_part_00
MYLLGMPSTSSSSKFILYHYHPLSLPYPGTVAKFTAVDRYGTMVLHVVSGHYTVLKIKSKKISVGGQP